jgi:CheY-like chemotaxis protein
VSKFKKILLIEDDSFISELYARALKKADYDVDAVINGPDGLKLAKSGKYDLILLDIMIPDMTGIEVLDNIRGQDNNALPNTKIIVTTNLDQDDQSRIAMEQQADGYLIKADVTPRTLVKFIAQLEEFGKIVPDDSTEK